MLEPDFFSHFSSEVRQEVVALCSDLFLTDSESEADESLDFERMKAYTDNWSSCSDFSAIVHKVESSLVTPSLF